MRPGFEVDHIGVAVNSLEEGFAFYKTLGWTEMDVEEVPSEKVKVGFIKFENQVNVELLEPTAEDSAVAKFIQKRGTGIHHICYRVKNIEQVIQKLIQEGVRMIHEKPKVGAHKCKIAFVHPSSCQGVLVELSEPASEPAGEQ